MQYLLTQAEMESLAPVAEVVELKLALAAARVLIVPIGKCVHDTGGPTYCDHCPLSGIRSGGLDHATSKRICGLSRRHSK